MSNQRPILALPTIYGGVRFRSRLEARWAVFFDALKIEWVYEERGYKLPSGACYLPDFYLPAFNGGCFVEVKPTNDPVAFRPALEFCHAEGSPMWLAAGAPRAAVYAVEFPWECEEMCVPLYGSAENEARFFTGCGSDDTPDRVRERAPHLARAEDAAREYQFDHRHSDGEGMKGNSLWTNN